MSLKSEIEINLNSIDRQQTLKISVKLFADLNLLSPGAYNLLLSISEV